MFEDPWEPRFDHLTRFALRVDGPAVDIQTRALQREPRRRIRQLKIRTNNVQQIFAVTPVEYRELGPESNKLAVFSQHSGRHSMKRPAHDASGCCAFARLGRIQFRLSQPVENRVHPSHHFRGSSTSKRQQQNPPRIGPIHNQARYAMGECRGLSGPCAGDNQ